jgi:hypothetical protein
MSAWSRSIGIVFVGLVLVPALTAYGDESLGDKEYWDREMAYMKDNIDNTNTRCGTNMTFQFANKVDFRKKASAAGTSPNGTCDVMLDNIGTVCAKGSDTQKRVQEKIKSVSCAWADHRSMRISGGKLILNNNTNEANFDDWAQAQLGNLL